MKLRDLRAEAKRFQEYYRGAATPDMVADHLGITVEELNEILNPTPAPEKAVKPVKVERRGRPKKVVQKVDGRAPLMSRFVLLVAHYGGAVALAAFEILFFISLAGTNLLMQVLLGLTATVFTLGEVGLWEKGVWEKNRKYKVIAACMALFSFIGGTAVSLGEVSHYERVSSIVDTSALNDEYVEYTERIATLEEKLRGLDPTWITRIRETNEQIDNLVTRRTRITEQIREANTDVAEASKTVEVFVLMANALKMSVSTVALLFLLFRTLMLIVVTLSTSPTKETENDTERGTPKLPGTQAH